MRKQPCLTFLKNNKFIVPSSDHLGVIYALHSLKDLSVSQRNLYLPVQKGHATQGVAAEQMDMENKKILCVDIGATKIHIGAIVDGAIVAEVILPTSAQAPQDQVLSEIADGIARLMDDQVVGIGMGVPGLVDSEAGVVYDVINIPSWQEVQLTKYMEERFKLPVYLTNDANTFVLGEKVYGKAKPYKNVIGITLGSGLGGGIIINNKLYAGSLSGAGEFGHIPYLDKNVEAYCGGDFFKSKYGVEGSILRARAEQGDEVAQAAFDAYGEHLGNAIHLALYTLSPEAIFLGGSISKSFPLFEKAMRKRVQAFPFKRITDRLVIEPSAIDNAALWGAAALFLTRHAEKTQTEQQSSNTFSVTP